MDQVSLSITNLRADLGTVDYALSLDLQRKLVRLRKEERIGNTILFLEHNPVYTIGRKHDPGNYPHINPVVTERGGDITYHGPGQIVSYMIFDTRVNGKRDVGKLLHDVENAVIGAAAICGFRLHVGSEPGFWFGDKKVGSLGMAMDDYVSFHGISLNYDPRVLDGFKRIRPCGLPPEVMDYIPVEPELFRENMTEMLSRIYGKFRQVDYDYILSLVSGYNTNIPEPLGDTKSLV